MYVWKAPLGDFMQLTFQEVHVDECCEIYFSCRYWHGFCHFDDVIAMSMASLVRTSVYCMKC